MNNLAPKYVTKEISRVAVNFAINAVMGNGSPTVDELNSDHCHIVVLVPSQLHLWESNGPLNLNKIYSMSIKKEKWEKAHDKIAYSMAMQLWHDNNDNRAGVIPHNLHHGDTLDWGGIKRDKIVVACSGFQSWYNRLVSSVVVDAIIALAHAAYEEDQSFSD